ncbi:MAG TPA: sugar transferase, partial [Longimicrobiales bacterium]|nr:sugar transferase [Longimicrobiales bacterium]
AILALAVKLDSPGPVFFRQRRAAYRGGFFELLKLRSMRADAETVLRADPEMYARYLENDFKLPENEDPRITPLGRTLRKTSLDELPQLINVVRGDMSLVGPRPVVEPELEMYRGRIPTFLSMKPGITGPWQISGRSNIGFPERAQMDLDYVRNWSLLRDGWILLLTLPAVVLRRGAH